MPDPVLHAGGCLCGRVRYEAEGEPILAALCHCGFCRRSAGAPVMAWAMFPAAAVRFTGEPPAVFSATPGARRSFCPTCGTQLGFEADYIEGLVDLTLGSFDAPERVTPQCHSWDSRRLPWMGSDDGLPRHAGFPPPPAA